MPKFNKPYPVWYELSVQNYTIQPITVTSCTKKTVHIEGFRHTVLRKPNKPIYLIFETQQEAEEARKTLLTKEIADISAALLRLQQLHDSLGGTPCNTKPTQS